MTDIDQIEQETEREEERNAADGKPRQLAVEVTELPKVHRNHEGQATSVVVHGKARFKGDVTLRLRGDIASAYWSVTPGMKLSVSAVERDDKDYEVISLDIMSA